MNNKTQQQNIEQQFKQALQQRQKQIPQILNTLLQQQQLLCILENINYLCPPLRDIAQNLSVYYPEQAVCCMLTPCIDCIKQAEITHKNTKNLQIQQAIRQIRERLNLLENLDKQQTIHPFTEIVQNLQTLLPNNTQTYTQLLHALQLWNKQAITFYKNIQKNYKLLKL